MRGDQPGVPGEHPGSRSCLSTCTRVSWRNKDIAGTLSAVICSTHICRSLRPGCLPLRCPGFPRPSRVVRRLAPAAGNGAVITARARRAVEMAGQVGR